MITWLVRCNMLFYGIYACRCADCSVGQFVSLMHFKEHHKTCRHICWPTQRKCQLTWWVCEQACRQAQLMLTNPCNAFRGQPRSPNIVTFHVGYRFLLCNSNFVFKMRHFSDILLQNCSDLANRVRGQSRSIEISPFDRPHMTSYWHSIVTMDLLWVVSGTFYVEKCCDLEIGVRGRSRSLNVVPFDRLHMVSY